MAVQPTRIVRRATAPISALATAARRPSTYTGHLREATSVAITAAMWPLGLRDGDPVDEETSSRTTAQTPVLLLHGFGANKSNWLLVRRRVEQAGFGRVHAMNYNPLRANIAELAEHAAERAEALRAAYGTRTVHLVGHSLGGLIARYAVQVHGLGGAATCITIASPHGGVRIARYGSPLSRLSPLAAGLELRPGSVVMRRLRDTARPMDTTFVAYYSNLDLIVPARRAMIQEAELCATNVLVKDHGHLSIMLSRRLASSIVDQLAVAEGFGGYGTAVVPLDGARRAPRTLARAGPGEADGSTGSVRSATGGRG